MDDYMKDLPIEAGSFVRTTLGVLRRGLVLAAIDEDTLLVLWEDEAGKGADPAQVHPSVVSHASLLEAIAAAAC